MPRITASGSRIDARRATTVGLTSLATLGPLLVRAKPSERTVLLLAALPAAVLFGYLAGYAAGSATHIEAAALQAAQVTDRQLRAAQVQAARPSAPVIRIVGESIPCPGSCSPAGSGHLVALAPLPRAHHPRQLQQGLSLRPSPSRGTSITGAAADAASAGPSDSSPHLTLIVIEHPTS